MVEENRNVWHKIGLGTAKRVLDEVDFMAVEMQMWTRRQEVELLFQCVRLFWEGSDDGKVTKVRVQAKSPPISSLNTHCPCPDRLHW